MKRFKCVGESTDPCGTLFMKCCVPEALLLFAVYSCVPEKIGKRFFEIRMDMCDEYFIYMSKALFLLLPMKPRLLLTLSLQNTTLASRERSN